MDRPVLPLRCAECGYPESGIKGTACPECGCGVEQPARTTHVTFSQTVLLPLLVILSPVSLVIAADLGGVTEGWRRSLLSVLALIAIFAVPMVLTHALALLIDSPRFRPAPGLMYALLILILAGSAAVAVFP